MNLLRDFVCLLVEKVELRIEVAITKHGVADQAMREWALESHEQSQHLVVRVPGEHDAAREQLVQRDSEAPQVELIRVVESEN